jgi:hypothetical protein
MHSKIAVVLIAVLFIISCKPKQPGIYDDAIGADTMCIPVLNPSEYLPQAEKGDIDAIYKAILYYRSCGDYKDTTKHSKLMYWEKKVADTSDTQLIEHMVGNSRIQLDPKNDSKDFSFPTDPLLLWAWSKKLCERVEKPNDLDIKKFGEEEISAMQAECNPITGPEWIPKDQWQKIITSPPTVKDRRWMQYLPKGCEQGQCLPK